MDSLILPGCTALVFVLSDENVREKSSGSTNFGAPAEATSHGLISRNRTSRAMASRTDGDG
jgi:hypothetical protein